MRIGIDNISPGEATSRRGPGGMRHYLQSLLSEFSARAPQHQFVLFMPRWADPLLETTLANVEIARLPHVPTRRALRTVYQQTGLAAAVARQNLDVFLATATVAPLFIPVPMVLVVQFLQFYAHPEMYGIGRTSYLRLMLPLSLRRARHAITFTEYAKCDLIRLTGVPAAKVHVIPHGLSLEVWEAANGRHSAIVGEGPRLTGGRPYIVYVSATYGYKNHQRLIRAFAEFKRQTHLPHVLLLVGSEVHVPYRVLEAEAKQAGVASDVIIAGRLPEAVPVYLDAALTVIPSLYETFGFPVLEAMALGCPVVTSNLGSMAELAGDAAVLVNPLSEIELAEAMAQVLTSPELRHHLIVRGQHRAAKYTWARSAEQTLRLLEAAAERSGRLTASPADRR